MLEIRKMDQETTDKFLESGMPSTSEFIGANISDGFANTTTGVVLDKLQETYSSSDQQRASDTQAQENINAFYEKRKANVVDPKSPQLKTYSLEDYKKSPHFRDGVAFQDGWGEARAKYLAENYDANREREEILKRGDTGLVRKGIGFASQMVGSLPDPVNLIPFGGAASSGAKIGEKIARAAIEGAVGNLAVSAVTRPYWDERGTDSDWKDYVNDIWIGGALGGGMGALGHAASTGFKKTDVPLKEQVALSKTGDAAIDSLATGDEMKIDLDAHNKAVESIYEIPEVQRSQKVQVMIEELQTTGMSPDEARIQVAPIVAHAEAFSRDMNMTMDDFLDQYGATFQESEIIGNGSASRIVKKATGETEIEIKNFIDSEIENMKMEISGAQAGKSSLWDNAEGRVGSMESTFPQWFRDLGFSSKDEFLTAIENKTTAYDKIRKYAEDKLAGTDPEFQALKQGEIPVGADGAPLFQFAGPNAKNAPVDKLNEARLLEKSGKDIESIRKETGWFKAQDGKWRFEIDDSAAKFKAININKKKKFKLSDVLEHEQLFEAYPQLRDMNIEFAAHRGRKGGHFSAEKNTIKIMVSQESIRDGFTQKSYDRLKELMDSPEVKDYKKAAFSEYGEARTKIIDDFKQSPIGQEYIGLSMMNLNGKKHFPIDLNTQAEAMNIILHEVQHSIQNVEGFARGGNTKQDGGFNNYRNLHGEIEARNTESRKSMTPEERAKTQPDTMNQEKAIIKWRGEEMPQSLPELKVPENKKTGDIYNAKSQTLLQSGKEGDSNFKEWFGSSKVVDASGQPLKLYHGTKGDFNSFSKESLGSSTGKDAAKGAFFFSDDPETAAMYGYIAPTKARSEYDRLSKLYEDKLTAGASEKSKEMKALLNKTEKAHKRTKNQGVSGKLTDIESSIIPVNAKIENPFIFDNYGKNLRTEMIERVIDQAKSKGHDGVIFKNTIDSPNPNAKASTIVAVFEPENIKSIFNNGEYNSNNPDILFKKSGGETRGAITFQDEGKAIIHLFENADQSTIIHETGHLFLNNLERFSALENASPQLKADLATIRQWMGVADGAKIETKHHEKFARGFEQYLREGKSPRPELNSVFSRFKEWLTSIYKSNKELKANLSDEARAVYSRLLGSESKKRPTLEARPEVKAPEPLFKDEADLDAKIPEIVAMVESNPGLASPEEIATLKESIAEIETEEKALNEILQFFQSAKDDAALLEAANKVGISKSQFERLIDDFNKKLQDEDAARLGIENLIEEKRIELATEAKELKRQAYLALSARVNLQNHVNSVIQGGGTAKQSILSIIEGDSSLRGVKGAGNSVDGSYMALAQSTSSRAFSELKKVDPIIEKLFENDVHFNNNVAKEMMKPDSSGDPIAKQAGEILSRYSEELRQRANLAGAKIGKLEGHVPRSHDIEKMIGKESQWVDFMMKHLDADRSFNPELNEAGRRASLKESFRSLITGEHTDELKIDTAEPLRRLPKNIAKKMGESRSLHFATPEAEVMYLRDFGQGENILESMAKHYENMSRKIALMERLGPNPESTIAYMVDKVRKDIDSRAIFSGLDDAATVKMLDDLGTTGSLKSRDSTIGQAMMQALGEVDTSQGTFKNYSQIARAVNSLSKLGSALLSQPGDFVHALNERRLLSNNNEASLWVDLFKDYFHKATPEQLEILDQLGIFVDAINYKNFNRFDADNINNKLARASDKMYRYSGQNWHVKHAKFAAGLSLSREMGSNISKSWKDVHPGLKEMLIQYGSFDEAKWNKINKIAPDMIEGKAYFHPGLLDKLSDDVFEDMLPDNLKRDSQALPIEGEPVKIDEAFEKARADEIKRERFKLEMDLKTFFVEESRNAAPEPDAKVRRQMNFGTKSGSNANEAVKLLSQFKTFAFVNYDRSIRGKRMMKNDKDYGGLLHHVTATLALGYISTVLKDLAKGNTPADPTLGKTWMRAAMQSGGLGIMGDFAGSAYSARSGSDVLSTLAGPTVSTIANTSVLALKAMHGETYEDGSKYASKWVDAARSIAPAPFSTLWYTRAAMDHLIWQNLKETLDPGSIKRSERRLKKEFNQQSIKKSIGF